MHMAESDTSGCMWRVMSQQSICQVASKNSGYYSASHKTLEVPSYKHCYLIRVVHPQTMSSCVSACEGALTLYTEFICLLGQYVCYRGL